MNLTFKERIAVIVALWFFIVFALIHEKLKEGYWFKLSDVFKFPTHESIIAIVTILALLAILVSVKRFKERA
jgi:hypothetical protein